MLLYHPSLLVPVIFTEVIFPASEELCNAREVAFFKVRMLPLEFGSDMASPHSFPTRCCTVWFNDTRRAALKSSTVLLRI